MSDLQRLHAINRAWRRWMDANTKFVTPGKTIDTLRYARNESREAKRELKAILDEMDMAACDAADIWQRGQLPEHARNNGRAKSLYQEFADVAMLVLTAIPDDFDFSQEPSFELEDMDYFCDAANSAVMHAKDDAGGWVLHVLDCLYFIDHYPGLDLAAELAACHERLAWKHGAKDADGPLCKALAQTGGVMPWLVEDTQNG